MIAETKIEFGANIFKALAHPTRLFIVETLGETGEMCVCDITDLVGDDMSTVSRHLSVLRNSGVVEKEKKGNEVHYRLRMPCVLTFLACVEGELEAQEKGFVHV